MKSTLLALALAATTLGASAQTLKSVQIEPASLAAGGEATVTVRFDIEQALNCHVRVEFGDGAQQNVVVNQTKDATMVLKHRYDKPGSYTVAVLPRTAMPVLKCTGKEQKAKVTVTAAAVATAPAGSGSKVVAVPAAAAAPACPTGWTLDSKSQNKKTGAFTCKAKAGTAAPEGKLACPGALGYFENAKKGQLGCRE
jgi:hypothetical protein